MNTENRNSSGGGPAIVGASILGALLVAGGLYWWQSRGSTVSAEPAPVTAASASPSEGDVAKEPLPATTAPSGDEEAGPDTGEHAECPLDTPEEVCSAALFVETARGRAFKVFPTVEMVDPAEFEARLLTDFNDYTDEIRSEEATMVALGLIPADSDLVDIFRESLSVGVVGFYDPETGELVIKGSDLDLFSELVIVHELTHAFDDQWFDLDRDEMDDLEGDAEYGYSAVIEGNASRVEDQWRNQLSEPDADELKSLELGLVSPEDLERYLAIPSIVLQLQIAPYTLGEDFVDRVFEESGEDGIDALFLGPPKSSEQIFHPEKFFDDEQPESVTVPSAGGEILDEGTFGELVIWAWLGSSAADGWAGDSYVTWDAGEGERCISANFATDSDQDRDELEESLQRWADDEFGREVTRAGDLLEILGCG